MSRHADPADRRAIEIAITPTGRDIVRHVSDRRRDDIRQVLGTMPERNRTHLVTALERFGAAGDEPPEDGWWIEPSAVAAGSGAR